MARPSNREERRAQIVDGMVRAMARQGYAGASVAAIAREAGLTPGLLHYHFPSKTQILLALVERLRQLTAGRFAAFAEGAADARARLVAYLDAHLALGEGADPDAVACWVALGTEALAQPEVREAYRAAVAAELETLEALVRATLLEAGGEVERTPTIASAIFAAIEGAYRLGVLAPGTIPTGSAARAVRAMTEGLLRDAGAA